MAKALAQLNSPVGHALWLCARCRGATAARRVRQALRVAVAFAGRAAQVEFPPRRHVIAGMRRSDRLRAQRPCRFAHRECNAVIVLQVKVKPRAGRSALLPQADGSWVAELKAPPVDGKANRELIALVARHFRCPQAAVAIKAGASGRRKLVRVET